MKNVILCASAATAALCILFAPWASQPARAANGAKKPAFYVNVENFHFSPTVLTVPPGSTVTWTNRDEEPHNVVSSGNKSLHSDVLDTDQKFSYTFTKPGSYAYFCSIHPMMTGSIIVKQTGKGSD